MTLGQLHAPPDCNLAPQSFAKARLSTEMFLPPARTSLPDFASPDRPCRPERADLPPDVSNVQCNLYLDTNIFEQNRRARPSLLGRARVIALRRLPNADCWRQRLALGDLHRGLTSPARPRLGLLEAAEARPIPRSPRGRIAQKVPHGGNGFPYLNRLCTADQGLIWRNLLVRRLG
jgi:hypothetical protein